MEKLVKVWNVGRMSYGSALRLQKTVADLHHVESKEVKNTIILVEHDPVYTIGIRRRDYSVEEEDRLKKLGAEFYRTNRGGLITFHGPGQLVAYPIINLKMFTPSIRWYVCQIEKTIIQMCKQLGIQAETSPHTGVWVGENKICAIGMHCSRYITSHGLALNCNTDLAWYNHIVPCGIEGKGVTSLSQELQRSMSIDEAAPLFINAFSQVFGCSYYYEKPNTNIINSVTEVDDAQEKKQAKL